VVPVIFQQHYLAQLSTGRDVRSRRSHVARTYYRYFIAAHSALPDSSILYLLSVIMAVAGK
jgi:hypothetical protein